MAQGTLHFCRIAGETTREIHWLMRERRNACISERLCCRRKPPLFTVTSYMPPSPNTPRASANPMADIYSPVNGQLASHLVLSEQANSDRISYNLGK